MRYAMFGDTYVLRLETGEEIVGTLAAFAADRRVDAGSITGIGAAFGVVLGFYDRLTREYLRYPVEGEVEIVSLSGNISIREGRAFPHLHTAVSGRAGEVRAGHLFEATVGGTCELFVRPVPGFVQRVHDPVTGLHLLDL